MRSISASVLIELRPALRGLNAERALGVREELQLLRCGARLLFGARFELRQLLALLPAYGPCDTEADRGRRRMPAVLVQTWHTSSFGRRTGAFTL